MIEPPHGKIMAERALIKKIVRLCIEFGWAARLCIEFGWAAVSTYLLEI